MCEKTRSSVCYLGPRSHTIFSTMVYNLTTLIKQWCSSHLSRTQMSLADPENVRGALTMFFSSHHIFYRWLHESHSRSNWSSCFLRVSIPVFLRKPIATCDFPGGRGPDALSPLWICSWIWNHNMLYPICIIMRCVVKALHCILVENPVKCPLL